MLVLDKNKDEEEGEEEEHTPLIRRTRTEEIARGGGDQTKDLDQDDENDDGDEFGWATSTQHLLHKIKEEEHAQA